MAKSWASIAICNVNTMLPVDSFTEPQYLNATPAIGEQQFIGIKPDGQPLYDLLTDGNYTISPSTWTSLGSQTLTVTYTGSGYLADPVYYTVNVISPEPTEKIIIDAELYEEVEATLVSIANLEKDIYNSRQMVDSGKATFTYSDGNTEVYNYTINTKTNAITIDSEAPGTLTYSRYEQQGANYQLLYYDWTDGVTSITDILLGKASGGSN